MSKGVEGAGAPGQVIESGPRLVVACGAGAVELIRVQRPGKAAQGGSAMLATAGL